MTRLYWAYYAKQSTCSLDYKAVQLGFKHRVMYIKGIFDLISFDWKISLFGL